MSHGQGLSSREREHLNWLESATQDESPESQGQGASFRPNPASTFSPNTGVKNIRDRENAQEFTQTTATPSEQWDRSVIEERANNVRIVAEHQRRREHEAKVAEYARLKAETDSRVLREHRERVTAQVIADDIKSQIRAIVADHYDILTPLTKLVKDWRMERNPDAWRAAVQTIREQQNQK